MKIYFVLILILGSLLSLSSQTKKIKNLEGQRKLVLQEIKTTNQLLSTTKKNTETLLDRINLLSKQIQSRNQVISLLNQEIGEIEKEQKRTESQISAMEVSLKEERDAYAKAIKSIIERKQQSNKLLFILSGNSFSESLRRLKYLKDYSRWREKQAELIKLKQAELQQAKESLNKTKIEKISLLANRKNEQVKLKGEEDSYQKEVTDGNLKQKELQSVLSEKQKRANNLDTQIQKLIAEEIARQEREAKRKAEEQERKRKAAEELERKRKAAEELERKRKAAELAAANDKKKVGSISKSTSTKEPEVKEKPTQVAVTLSNKTYVTKENLQMSSTFEANKGRLPKPITGRSILVGKFGIQHHNKWNVETNNNGIDLKSQSGAQALAVFDGEVSRIVAFPGFNNCIIIRHGGYYTFYGNIQNVIVKQGQKVSTNQALGSVYTDTDNNSSTLHFQLWKGTTKLNPEPWIRK